MTEIITTMQLPLRSKTAETLKGIEEAFDRSETIGEIEALRRTNGPLPPLKIELPDDDNLVESKRVDK